MHKTRVEVTKDEMKSARRALKIVRELQTILGTDDYLDDLEMSLGKLILENSHKRDLEEKRSGFRSSGFGSKKPFEGGSTGFGLSWNCIVLSENVPVENHIWEIPSAFIFPIGTGRG